MYQKTPAVRDTTDGRCPGQIALESIDMPERTRVLLVDDYPDTVDMWALYLRYCGYDVFTASEGQEAIDVATRMRPDVMVLDMTLPGMSGAEVARRLRESPSTANIRFIAATGHSHVAHAGHEPSVFESVLIKPCEPTALANEIARVVSMGGAK
jgi:CheY-like chemotaxis protein